MMHYESVRTGSGINFTFHSDYYILGKPYCCVLSCQVNYLFVLLVCFSYIVITHSSLEVKMSKQVLPLNLYRLTKVTESDTDTINFCKEISCLNCGTNLTTLYKFKNRSSNTFRYQCNKRNCRRKGIKNTVTLRANTWFNEARISIRKSLFMTYCFVYQMSYKDTMRETAITCNDLGEFIETSRETV